jgi:hypothetical protein
VESIQVKEGMTVVENPTTTIAEASAALDTALVLASTSLPCPSLASQFIDDQHLANEVVQEFDVTHRLSELFAAWANLMAGMTSFGELLQVTTFTFSLPFLFDLVSRLLFPFSFLLSFLCKAFSWDQSSFFGSARSRRSWSSR